MAKSVKKTDLPLGTIFEYRVARLRFWQGYFVRRSIDVWPNTLEGDKLAEIDALAITFDPQLRRFTEVLECKTTSGGQGEIDRLLWLKGVCSLVNARSTTLAKLKVSPRSRDFARQVEINILDEDFIGAAEKDLGISNYSWIGFHNPEFGEKVVKPARSALSGSQDLRRAGKYLFGSFWFTDDFSRIKQIRTLFRLLIESRDKIPLDAFLLGIGESTTLLVMTILSITAWRYQMVDDVFNSLVVDELSTGLGDRRSLRNLLRNIDQLQRDQIDAIHSAYQTSGAGRIAFPMRSLEQEILTPPEWVDGLIDLISRFARRPNLATQILQWTDLWAAELLGAPRNTSIDSLFQEHEKNLAQALELVLTFLQRMWHVPPDVFRNMNNTNTTQIPPQQTNNAEHSKISVSSTESASSLEMEKDSPDSDSIDA